jgi:hypothetical protein
MDHASRYLLAVHVYDSPNYEDAKRSFEQVFRQYGLPERIRSDNGPPFATTGVAGLSRLAIWWIRLGIRPERIERGKPQQNGRHERMHRTLKAEVASPPASEWQAQRDALERWRTEFNEVRPHEALSLGTPASRHTPSPRVYPGAVGDPDYPAHFDVRRVNKKGVFSMSNKDIVLGHVLAQECIGLEPLDDGLWHLWFGPVFLGALREVGRKTFHLEKSRPVLRSE